MASKGELWFRAAHVAAGFALGSAGSASIESLNNGAKGQDASIDVLMSLGAVGIIVLINLIDRRTNSQGPQKSA